MANEVPSSDWRLLRNHLDSFAPVAQAFPNSECLNFSENHIKDPDDILTTLNYLIYLKSLAVHGNPLDFSSSTEVLAELLGKSLWPNPCVEDPAVASSNKRPLSGRSHLQSALDFARATDSSNATKVHNQRRRRLEKL
ncbi:hypothetical protein TcWFU_004323 [Taenia crassiceps]|uniref:Uncharacterized protein n=1 Tax=Taenia crassiceps TaxID=6207 RepID=A0ABR4QDN0_9CEST